MINQGRHIEYFSQLSTGTGLQRAHVFPEKLSVVLGIPETAGASFLSSPEVNMLEENMSVQNKTRDLRISKRTLEQPVAKVLADNLNVQHNMVARMVHKNTVLEKR